MSSVCCDMQTAGPGLHNALQCTPLQSAPRNPLPVVMLRKCSEAEHTGKLVPHLHLLP